MKRYKWITREESLAWPDTPWDLRRAPVQCPAEHDGHECIRRDFGHYVHYTGRRNGRATGTFVPVGPWLLRERMRHQIMTRNYGRKVRKQKNR